MSRGLNAKSRFDGIVVAKEMEEIVLEAWHMEEQLSIEKDIKVMGDDLQ